MEQEAAKIESGPARRFSIYLAAAGAGAGFYSAAALIQNNAYDVPNKFYKLFKVLGEPTYLPSAPLVYIASMCSNFYLLLLESFSSKHETLSSLLHYSQYFTPLLVVLAYSFVEYRFGGITTPDIGPDTLWEDVASGLVGGVLASLTAYLADQSIKKDTHHL